MQKFGFSSRAALFFFRSSHKLHPSKLPKISAWENIYVSRPSNASIGLTAVNTSLTCGRQSSLHPLATEETQVMATKKKKHHAPARRELEYAQQPKNKVQLGSQSHRVFAEKKKLLFSALSSWHAHRVYIAVVGCTSKLKYSQLFSETWCCSARQCHSWRRRFLHAAPRRSTSRREKVDRIDKMFCSICERAAEEAGTGSVNVDFIFVYLKHVWKFFIWPNNWSVNRENLQLFW